MELLGIIKKITCEFIIIDIDKGNEQVFEGFRTDFINDDELISDYGSITGYHISCNQWKQIVIITD